MRLKLLTKVLAVAAIAFPLTTAVADAYELVIPATVYRTGPYAPNGIPFANGYGDYYRMLNERDGGIEGVKIKYLECETAYNTKQGVECYENTKGEGPSGALAYQPLSTGITYQLIPKASADKIPVFSMGYGRTSAANGKVFPYIFNFPATYWDQASVFVKYIGEKEGGMDKLKGKKIALVYHNSAYGKEPIRTLEELSKKHGFDLQLLAVDHPGQEQKATWLQVRRKKPDWVMMWGWGVMNQVAIKEAASIRFPMDRFIGVWWSGSENDVLPAGEAAHGYLSGAFHAAGDNFRAHDDIKRHVYDKGNGGGDRDRIGEVLYNRGLVAAMWTAEAIRTAMRIHNTKEVTGEHVRDGFEALNVDAKRLAVLGLEGFTYPVKITCENHQGPGKVALQQWDAKEKKWNFASDFYTPDADVVGKLIAEDSANYAAENNITPRTCN
ncbi:ABC transporter substrate-binding protein [Rhodospirillales bacterium]|jgi:branched-chain amino acid transport system substrate-binding protein|nr:ABC transporter substrate-binding protein [Rhodospirillales bacterium]